MKLIQMIIVSSTYLIVAIAIMAFIQGFVYQASGKKINLYKMLMRRVHRYLRVNTNDRRKLKYTQIEECRKVG